MPVKYPVHYNLNSVRHINVTYWDRDITNIIVGSCISICAPLYKVCIIESISRTAFAEHWFITTDAQLQPNSILYQVSSKIYVSGESVVVLYPRGISQLRYCNRYTDNVAYIDCEFTKVQLSRIFVQLRYKHLRSSFESNILDGYNINTTLLHTNCARILHGDLVANGDKPEQLYPWNIYNTTRDFAYDLEVATSPFKGPSSDALAFDFEDTCDLLACMTEEFICKHISTIDRCFMDANPLLDMDRYASFDTYRRITNMFSSVPVNHATDTVFNNFTCNNYNLFGYEPLSLLDSSIMYFCCFIQTLAVTELEFTYILPICKSSTSTIDVVINRMDLAIITNQKTLYNALNMLYKVEVKYWFKYDSHLKEIRVVKTNSDELYIWFIRDTSESKYYVDLTLASVVSQELCVVN